VQGGNKGGQHDMCEVLDRIENCGIDKEGKLRAELKEEHK
jgi:hypothetical protein